MPSKFANQINVMACAGLALHLSRSTAAVTGAVIRLLPNTEAETGAGAGEETKRADQMLPTKERKSKSSNTFSCLLLHS